MSATLKKAFDKEVTEQVAKQVKEQVKEQVTEQVAKQVKIHSDKENARLIQIFEDQFKEHSENEKTRLIQIFEKQFEEHSAKQKKKYETQYSKLKDEVNKETRLKTQLEEKVAEKVVEIKKLTNATNELKLTKNAIQQDLKDCIKGKGKCEPCEPCEPCESSPMQTSPMQTSPTHSASRKNSKSQTKRTKSPQSQTKRTKSPQSNTKSPRSNTKSPRSQTKSPINCYDSYKNNFITYKRLLEKSLEKDKNLQSGKRFVMMNGEKTYLNVKTFEEYAFHGDAPFQSVDAFIKNFHNYEQAKHNMMWFHRFNNYENNARLKRMNLLIHTDRYTGNPCMDPDGRVIDEREQEFINKITEINKNISGLSPEYFKEEGDENNIRR